MKFSFSSFFACAGVVFTAYCRDYSIRFHYSYTSRALRDKISTSVSCSFYYIFDISRRCCFCFASNVAFFFFCPASYMFDQLSSSIRRHCQTSTWIIRRCLMPSTVTFHATCDISILITRTLLITRSHTARNVTSKCTNWVHRQRKFRSVAPLSYLDGMPLKVNGSDAI